MQKSSNNKWLVYKHTSPSGKVYIGITSWLPCQRWMKGNGYKKCVLFYKAIKKYGWNNIKHEVLLRDISESEAIYAEKYLIRWYKMHSISYNLADGGDGVSGTVFSEKQLEHARNLWKGKKIPIEIRKKMSESHKGMKFTPEWKESIRISKLGNGSGNKPVYQFDLLGNLIAKYKSSAEAAEMVGVTRGTIYRACKGVFMLHHNIFVTSKEPYDIVLNKVLNDVRTNKYVEVLK